MSTREKLQQILLFTGWSQDKLSDELQVSFVTLNSWVNGKSEPRDKQKEKIDFLFAKLIGVDWVDEEKLITLKKEISKYKLTVKKLVSDKEILDRVTVNLTYHTNNIEGSTMTESDVAAVLLDNKVIKNRTAIEQREAVNHQTALHFLLDELQTQGENFRLSPDLVLLTHLRLMNGVISNAGQWRNHSVRIRGANVALANYLKIPALMVEWCEQNNEETLDPIARLAVAHAEFEKIHPFSDGNGRTGRLLMFVWALKYNLCPPIISQERKMAYYKYLEICQNQGLSDLLELFLVEEMLNTKNMVGF
jgi:Fic family protein